MDALQRLIKHAEGDTGGSRRAAQFLLSLWNGDNYQVDLQAVMRSSNYYGPEASPPMYYGEDLKLRSSYQ